MPRSLVYTFGRVSLCVIYFWFGLLKLLGFSPAGSLVEALYHKTPFLSSIPFAQFYIAFAIFEMIIGIAFLFPRFTKLACVLFVLHMISTTMPLFALPSMTWQSFFVPTLEGQYIIKNLALVSVVAFLVSYRR